MLSPMFKQKLIVAAIVVSAAVPARAEFVVDDFDDSAALQLPQMKFDTAVTTDVGSFAARRNLDVSTGAQPVGVFAADSVVDSALISRLGPITPESVNGRSINLTFGYTFDFVDAIEGGVNDAILLDFRSFRKGNVFAVLDVFAADDVTGRHNVAGTPLPNTADPFTVAIPFAAFTRGASVLHVDQLRGLSFRMRLTAPAGVNQLDFEMALDRVRISKVPEPTVSILCSFAVAWLLLKHRRGCKAGGSRVGVLVYQRGFTLGEAAKVG
jgi:hypothetical protein